ncbi:PIN domain-containing protein [Archaeoglobus sp.]
MREIFLDTTFVMPFFYMDIDVKGFSRKKFAELIRKLDKIHISEISIFEAKAKVLQNRSEKVLKKFNEGLSILRSDRRVVIHGYTAKHDQNFNDMLNILNDVNVIDLIIIAQAKEVGTLLTEDRIIHKHKDEIEIEVLNWKSFVRRF